MLKRACRTCPHPLASAHLGIWDDLNCLLNFRIKRHQNGHICSVGVPPFNGLCFEVVPDMNADRFLCILLCRSVKSDDL